MKPSQIERGITNPSLTASLKLAVAFKTSVAALLDDEGDVARQVLAVPSTQPKRNQIIVLHVVEKLVAEL